MTMTYKEYEMIQDVKMYLENETDLQGLQYMGFNGDNVKFEYIDRHGNYNTLYVNINDFNDKLEYHESIVFLAHDHDENIYHVDYVKRTVNLLNNNFNSENVTHEKKYKYEKSAMNYAKKLQEKFSHEFPKIEVANC